MRPALAIIAVVFVLGPAVAANPVKHRVLFAEYGKGPNRLAAEP